MEREKLGSTDNPDTRSAHSQPPRPSTNDSFPSVGTFNHPSAMSGTSHDEIPKSEVSEQNAIVPTRTSFSRVTSTFTTTRWAARPTTTRRLTKCPDEYKTKTSRSHGDETIAVGFTSEDNQGDDLTVDMSLASPGAVSVPGISLAGSPNNELDQSSVFESSVIGKRTSSFVVAAELVTEQEEDLENRINQEVEERLKKHDPKLAVAEVIPPVTTMCKLFCWKWKYLLLFVLLGICGAIVGAKISAKSDKTPSPEVSPTVAPTIIDKEPIRNSTRDKETQGRIQEVLERHATIEEDPTNASPQLRAWEWLLYNDTNNLMQNNTISDTVILERYVLAVFFYSTSGDKWIDQLEFLTPATVCQWNNGSIASPYGVLCDADGTVQEIELSGNGLSGTLPSELSLLSNLQSLSLEINLLMDTIPTELGELTALQVLSLVYNQLNGTLPTELGQLTNLQAFMLEDTLLTGTLPTELGKMVSLERLSLQYNQFTGTLPTELGRLVNLQALDVVEYGISGSLPTELGLMTSLTSIMLGFAGLTETLPTELGRLTNLTSLISYSNFTGPLPTELGRMTSLAKIDVDSNSLTGTLPTELGLMTSLIAFIAPYNFFTGTLPTELIKLTALERLHVYNNYMNGTVPAELLSNPDLLVDFDPQLRPGVNGRK